MSLALRLDPYIDVRAALKQAQDTHTPLDLQDAPLAGADLSHENLRGAQLMRADLSNVDLSGADLTGADLSGATLCGVNLEGACLAQARLVGVHLDQAKLGGAILGGADLSGASFFQADLHDAVLTSASLVGADLRAANLRNVHLRDADLTRANLARADLRGADMVRATVTGAVFHAADLRGSRPRQMRGFRSADWVGVDIRDVELTGAHLLRRHIIDENYLHEFRTQNRTSELIYQAWWLTSDCGRSIGRWVAGLLAIVVFFAMLYAQLDIDWGDQRTPLSPLYFSFVTVTTLGYGDVLPISASAQAAVIVQVVLGYVGLGGLLSIVANKMARRGD